MHSRPRPINPPASRPQWPSKTSGSWLAERSPTSRSYAHVLQLAQASFDLGHPPPDKDDPGSEGQVLQGSPTILVDGRDPFPRSDEMCAGVLAWTATGGTRPLRTASIEAYGNRDVAPEGVAYPEGTLSYADQPPTSASLQHRHVEGATPAEPQCPFRPSAAARSLPPPGHWSLVTENDGTIGVRPTTGLLQAFTEPMSQLRQAGSVRTTTFRSGQHGQWFAEPAGTVQRS